VIATMEATMKSGVRVGREALSVPRIADSRGCLQFSGLLERLRFKGLEASAMHLRS